MPKSLFLRLVVITGMLLVGWRWIHVAYSQPAQLADVPPLPNGGAIDYGNMADAERLNVDTSLLSSAAPLQRPAALIVVTYRPSTATRMAVPKGRSLLAAARQVPRMQAPQSSSSPGNETTPLSIPWWGTRQPDPQLPPASSSAPAGSSSQSAAADTSAGQDPAAPSSGISSQGSIDQPPAPHSAAEAVSVAASTSAASSAPSLPPDLSLVPLKESSKKDKAQEQNNDEHGQRESGSPAQQD